MEASFQSLNAVNLSVAEYFCEDPNQFKLEECCTIFDSFCKKFLRATQVSMTFDLSSALGKAVQVDGSRTRGHGWKQVVNYVCVCVCVCVCVYIYVYVLGGKARQGV